MTDGDRRAVARGLHCAEETLGVRWGRGIHDAVIEEEGL
jgi:hypothetical protein